MKNSEKSAGVYRIRRAFSSDFSSQSAQDWCLVIGAELLPPEQLAAFEKKPK